MVRFYCRLRPTFSIYTNYFWTDPEILCDTPRPPDHPYSLGLIPRDVQAVSENHLKVNAISNLPKHTSFNIWLTGTTVSHGNEHKTNLLGDGRPI